MIASAEDGFGHCYDVRRVSHRRSALLEKPIGSFASRIERRAGHREDFAALFAGEPRSDKGAGAAGCFDDHNAKRKAGDQAIAARKIVSTRLARKRHLRYCGAIHQNFVQQFDVFGRINAAVPAGEHGNGSCRKACAVSRSVDPARQTRHGGKACLAEIMCDAFRKFHTGCRSVPRADDGDQWLLQRLELTAQSDDRWRIADHLQA